MKREYKSNEEGENLFQNLLKRNNSVMLLIDPETGKILDSNEAAKNYYGYKNLDSLNIKTINQLTDNEVKKYINRASTEEKKHFEFKHLLADGSIRDVEVYSTPVTFQKKTLLFSIIHDITAKKEAEQTSKILSDAIYHLLEFKTPAEIYKYTCSKLYEILKEDAIVTIVEYDTPNNKWKMMEYRGINSILEKTLKRLGIDPHKLEGEIKTDYLEQLHKGKITSQEFNLPRLSNGKYSQKTANAIKKIFPIKQLLSMPFIKGDTIYGNVSIISAKDTRFYNLRLIESFISQAATFIEKLVVNKDLRESERKLLEAEKIAHIGNYEINLDTGQATWSEETFNIFGLNSKEDKEPTVEEYSEFIHPDDRQKLFEMYSKCIAENKKFDLQYRIIRKDNQIRFVHSIGQLEKNSENESTVMIGTFRDITEQKMMEDELLKSEKKYRAIFENSHDMISVHPVNENGFEGFPKVNSQTLKILGYEKEEFKNMKVFDIVPKEEHAKIQKGIEEIFKKGEYRLETLHITKSGKIIPVEIKGYFFTVDNEKFLTIVTRNLEKQKKAEQDLIDSKNYYQSLIENSTDVVSILDENATIVYESPSHKQILGYNTNELIGVNGFNMINPEDIERVKKQFSNLLKKPGQIENINFRYRHKNGNWLYLEGTAKNLLQNDAIKGIVINYRDVTERVRSQKELIKAKEKAEESERLKTAFLANMSHEIRTPMNGILGFIDILNEPEISKDDKETYFDLVKKSGERLLTTINDIIQISKIEANQTFLSLSDEDLNEIMNEHLNFFMPEAEQNNISLKIAQKSDHDQVIRTDKNKLDSILTNLIKNAFKFTSNGAIEFGCTQKDRQLEFFVKDTGVGIAPERIDAIFNRFEQAELGINRGHEGTGLGLSISKAYAKMLGGDLWVKSKKGEGSTFFFTISLNPLEGKTDEKSLESEKQTIQQTNNAGKILVVEDDKISFSLIETYLSKENVQLLHAKNGQEAIKMAKEQTDIDLILMDLKMPETDGFTATREIRKFNKNIPIIAQTAYALPGDSEKALNAGCNDYVTKPLRKTELLKKINEHRN